MPTGWTAKYKSNPKCTCGPHETASIANRRCCVAAIVDGEHTIPQGFYILVTCNYRRLADGKNSGFPNAVCTDPNAKENILPTFAALNKECVRGCRYVSRRDSAADPDAPCCDSDAYISGPQYLDTEESELSCVGWVLEVTSPTSATLTYFFRNGDVATYESPIPWNPLRPANFTRTSTDCESKPLPPQLCVYPYTVSDGERGCRSADNTCDCCDDYDCTGVIRLVVNCPDGPEPIVYDGTMLRWQWEDDFPEGYPNGLNGNMFQCAGLLPTTSPFAGFGPIFSDFPATYANAPCGVWIGSVGPFSYMIACVGDDTYHLRLTCIDPDTDEQTIVLDQEYTSQCLCPGWTFTFDFDNAPCVECPGVDPPIETECCEEPTPASLDVEVVAFTGGGDFQPGCEACLGAGNYPAPLSGTTININYDSGTEIWDGSVSVCGVTLRATLECNNPGFANPFLLRLYVNGVEINNAALGTGGTFTCSPFYGETSSMVFSSMSDCVSLIATVSEAS